jgi:hypothetical protein
MKIERRIQITSMYDNIYVDFMEQVGRRFESVYYMLIDGDKLTTVETVGLMRAWMEHDDANMNSPELTIPGV